MDSSIAIFRDNTDRNNFSERLGNVLTDSGTPCYAWALIPNHVHLLLKTGNISIATVVQRLLTGHAAYFNRRHKRYGQNRYKSILCQEDAYLLELVRYIHLNPLRADLVDDLQKLGRFLYCGHSRIVGRYESAWQDVSYVLQQFGKRGSSRKRFGQEACFVTGQPENSG